MNILDKSSDNQEFFYDYSLLPHTIIQQIFSNVSPKDFKHCLLTCKSWYYVSLHPKFTAPLKFLLDENNITVVSLINRKYHKVKLNYLNFTKHNVHYLKYFKSFGKHIKQLSIHRCSIEIHQIIIIFKYLNNLTRLEIDDCNNIFISKGLFNSKINGNDRTTILANFSNIKCLKLTSKNMNYDTLEKFLCILPNLEHLEFSMLSNPKFNKNFTKIVEILSKIDITKLKRLSVSVEDKEDIILELFAGIDASSIKSLKLKLDGIVDSDFMWEIFCQKFSGLEEFNIIHNISQSFGLNEVSLPRYISQYMMNLKRLYLTKVPSLLETIFRLKYLEVLHITTCMDVDTFRPYYMEETINVDLIFVLLLPNLKSFSFDYIVRESTLEKIAEFCPNLENLDLKLVDTLNCESIFKSLLKLKKLRIIFAPWVKLNDEDIKEPEYTISRLVVLEELYTNLMVPSINEDDLKKLAHLSKAITPLFSMSNKKIHNFYTKFN